MLPYTGDYIEHIDDNIDNFNSTAKAINLLQEQGILVQMNSKERNRIWEHMSLKNCILSEL